MKRNRIRLLAAASPMIGMLLALAGCGKQDDAKPPEGSTYYEGPMIGKSKTGTAQGAQQQGNP